MAMIRSAFCLSLMLLSSTAGANEQGEALFNWAKKALPMEKVDLKLVVPADGKLEGQMPTIELLAKTGVVLKRNVNNSIETYRLRVKSVGLAQGPIPMMIKSTTCDHLPKNLSCKFMFGSTNINFEFVPETGRGPTHEETLNLENLSLAFVERYFPEFAKLRRGELVCNNWNWTGKNPGIKVIESGVALTMTKVDVGAMLRDQSRLLGARTCPNKTGGCPMLPEKERESINAVTGLIDENSTYLEVEDGSGSSCTVEFQTANFTEASERLSKMLRSNHPQYGTPAIKASILRRLTPEFFHDWALEKLDQLADDASAQNSNFRVEDTFRYASLTELSFFNLISVQSLGVADQSGRRPLHIVDRFGVKEDR